MDVRKVKEQCDVLRDLIDLGSGDNPEVLRRALGIVRSLRAAAEWDYPRQILDDAKERLRAWVSNRKWRGDEAELRRSLLQYLDELPPSWERPTDGG